jgi:hypothetical protein
MIVTRKREDYVESSVKDLVFPYSPSLSYEQGGFRTVNISTLRRHTHKSVHRRDIGGSGCPCKGKKKRVNRDPHANKEREA